MSFNYAKLIGRIAEKCETRREFARAMQISEHTISHKLSNKAGWKQEEIKRACEILDISANEIPIYFFAT